MGKRSDFTRMKNDSYDTPTECVSHLVRMMALIEGHKYPGEPRRFVEPCAGRGALVDELESRYGWVCTDKFDIEPRAPGVKKADFTKVTLKRLAPASALVVTNPPWTRLLLHALVDRLIEAEAEAYLLVDGNWLFTMQARVLHEAHIPRRRDWTGALDSEIAAPVERRRNLDQDRQGPAQGSGVSRKNLAVRVVVDARGTVCPIPVLRLKRALALLPAGSEVELLADDPMTMLDATHFCNQNGHRIEADPAAGVFLIVKSEAQSSM